MLLAADTETELVHSISPEIQITDRPVPRLCVMSWAVPGQAGLVHNKDPELVPTVRKILSRESVWANPAFDLAVFIEHDDEFLRPVFEALRDGRVKDVLIREMLIDLAHGKFNKWPGKDYTQYSLGGVVQRRLNVHLDKDTWRLRYGELIDTPLEQWPEEARLYPKNDATSTLCVYQDQENRRAEFAAEEDNIDLLQDQDNQTRAAWALHLMGIHGILVDQERVSAFAATVEQKWQEAKARLQTAGIVRSDGTRDTKAAEKRMAQMGGSRLTDGGKLSLDAEACIESGDQILIDYADYGSLLKLKSTYIAPMLAAENLRIHPRWNVMVTTGRTSCARPNLQQLPQVDGVRQCYRAAPGHVLVGRDYGGIEFVTFAKAALELFGYSTIAEAMKQGKDAHLMVAATLRNITYEQALAMRKSDPASIHMERQLGKVANYGFLGGAGPETFAKNAWKKSMRNPPHEQIRLSVQDAADLKNGWLGTWPEARDYLNMISDATREGGMCIRSLVSGRCHADKGYTDGANAYFQMLAADLAKEAGWHITWRQYLEPDSALYGTRCCIFAHDEWVIECPEDRAKAAADELGEVMLETARKYVDPVPVTVGEAVIGTHWSK